MPSGCRSPIAPSTPIRSPSACATSPTSTWPPGDAERPPFPDRSFDPYTIAFGLRNVTDIDKALADAHRVLKPGGRFYCLEFSKVTSAPVARAYDAYSERALPFFGRVVARDADSYQYLHESIR